MQYILNKGIFVPGISRRNTKAEEIHGSAFNTLVSFYSLRYRDTRLGMLVVHGLSQADSGPTIVGYVSAATACVNSIHGVACQWHRVCHTPVRAPPSLSMRQLLQLV